MSTTVLQTSLPPRPGSRNLGEVDYDALIENNPQDVDHNLQGNYTCYRIGDAVASLNIHAAIYDALTLEKDL